MYKQQLTKTEKFIECLNSENYSEAKAMIVGRFNDSVSTDLELKEGRRMIKKFGIPARGTSIIKEEYIADRVQITVTYPFPTGKDLGNPYSRLWFEFTFLKDLYNNDILHFYIGKRY